MRRRLLLDGYDEKKKNIETERQNRSHISEEAQKILLRKSDHCFGYCDRRQYGSRAGCQYRQQRLLGQRKDNQKQCNDSQTAIFEQNAAAGLLVAELTLQELLYKPRGHVESK